ncbi:hypothetical protein ACHAXR_013326 [Thalassiosira sp. AJA248-18]
MLHAAPLSPSTFLSPRITADLENSLENIEELLLAGDELVSPSSTDASPLAETLNTASATDKRSSTESKTLSSYNCGNAVHMEVQENAKLPTFNLPIDRSNASWQIPAPRGRRSLGVGRRAGVGGGGRQHHSLSIGSVDTNTNNACPASPIPKLRDHTSEHGLPMDSATSRAIDEIMRLNENDMNLSEEFLGGATGRSSAALAYSNSLSDGSKTKDNGSGKKNGRPQSASAHQPFAPGTVFGPPHPSAKMLPYNRSKPLPIPTLKKPSPPRGHNTAATGAVATAAAIATQTSPNSTVGIPGGTAAAMSVTNHVTAHSTANVSPPQKGPMPPHLAPRSTPIPPSAKPTPNFVPKPGTPARPGPPPIPPPKGSVLANKPGVVKPPPHQYPPGYPYAAQAQARARQLAASSKTKGSIAHATIQRSKFGFGGDHKVPSVPAPPPSVRGYPNPTPNPLAYSAAAAAAAPRHSPYVSSSPGIPKDVGSVIAYERKKQRAKTARVKLNDSIESLAVAIDLAGSQSKERFNYITKSIVVPNNAPHPPKHGEAFGPPQHPLARLMDETIQQASNAKKWDRPSFVGLSANIIHSLNAQCEGLMREVAQLRKLTQRDMSADTVTSCAAMTCASMTLSMHTQQNGVRRNQATLSGQAAKKQKLDSPQNANTTIIIAPSQHVVQEQQRCIAIHITVQTPTILKNIATYLDPTALCKCLCVAKRWRAQNIFQNPELWLNLCIKRFGASAVRKWQDNEDEGVRKNKKTNTNLHLYRKMSEKNVKPYCPIGEGSVFLGGSTLDGLACCWVTLMDRSNGETSRSVMQQKVQDGEKVQYYGPIPVVEIRILVQNTGYSKGAIVIPDQQFSVDASTRRKGEKMLEVSGDDRFKRQVLHIERRPSLDGKPNDPEQVPSLSHEMCHLRLYESAVISLHLHARGCSTTTKFCNRSKQIQLLVSINGTTRPLVIPFHCMNEHQLKQIH